MTSTQPAFLDIDGVKAMPDRTYELFSDDGQTVASFGPDDRDADGHWVDSDRWALTIVDGPELTDLTVEELTAELRTVTRA